jgi:small subunit ribosomal protein S8
MSVTAPTQDLLIRIKNAYMARKTIVESVVHSNFLESMILLLKKYKFVREYTVVADGNKKSITIYLHQVVNPVQDIPVVRLFSKPSRRRYIGYKDIKPVA